MREQNFKNHARFVPIFHFVLLAIILTVCVMATIDLVSAFMNEGGKRQALMFFLIGVALLISFFKIRRFPIMAQDRAIRAEENLRYFALTGKLLDSRLTISQIIALRFAPDNELLALTDRALKENLSSTAIKKAIQHWKADHYRA